MERNIMICEVKDKDKWKETFRNTTSEEVYECLAEDLLERYNKNSNLYRITRRKEPQTDCWKITTYFRDAVNGGRYRYIYYITFE